MNADLNYIYEIYKTGSFSKAAENLFISQPALSKSVKKTEDAVGMPLFDRKSHPLAVTDAGMCFVRAAEKLQLLERDLDDELSDLRNLRTGAIRIGGANYINTAILPPVLTSFHEKYPGIKVSLVEASSAELSKMLAAGELDLTLSCNPAFMRNFERVQVFSDNLLMAVPWGMDIDEPLEEQAFTFEEVAAGAHLSGTKAPVPISAFRGLPFIALGKGNNLFDRAREIYESAGFVPEVRIVLQQMSTALKLAESGYGITITCDRLIRTTRADLRYFALATPLAKRDFYALLPRRAYRPAAVRRFLGHLTEAV